MKKEYLISKRRLNRIFGIIIDILVLDVADTYLNLLKKDKDKNIPEFILNYLDNSILLSKRNIKIKKIKNKIINFTNEELKEFINFLEKNINYKKIVEDLNLVFNFINDEKLRYDFFEIWYNDLFLNWKNNEFKKNKEQQINNKSIINKFITKYKTNNNYLTINNI